MDKPAICGGTPVRDTKIYYGHQYLDQADYDAVVDVLKSDYLTCGPKITELEEKYDELEFTMLSDQGEYIHIVVNSVLQNLLLET